jgi:hypothetical protein
MRFCADCRQQVYNLSEMPLRDAEALIEEKHGQLCVRYEHRADGSVITKDCPDHSTRKLHWQIAWAASCVLASLMLFFLGEQDRSSGQETGLRVGEMEPFRTILRWIMPASRTMGKPFFQQAGD